VPKAIAANAAWPEHARAKKTMANTPMLRVALVAPPGAGKGTQGRRLALLYDVAHISAGDVLRDQVARETANGRLVAEALEKGQLVPDAVVINVISDELTKATAGFILDGFPRTLDQVIAAEQRALFGRRPLQAVIALRVPEEELVARLQRRSSHSQRPDDTRDTIEYRLALHRRNGESLLGYYRRRKILITIDGTGAVEEVTQRIRGALDHVLAQGRQGLSGLLRPAREEVFQTGTAT
jgi:adenylate kinase